MASEMRKGTPSDGCSFYALDVDICAGDANKVADQPCGYCVAQHPFHLSRSICIRRVPKKDNPNDRVHDRGLIGQLYKLWTEASQLPAGEFPCFSRHPKRCDFKLDDKWFLPLFEGRDLHNNILDKDTLFPRLIVCEPTKNPMQLCGRCVQVMRLYFKVKDFIEEEGSKQQKKLFTEHGVVTFGCVIMERPEG